MKITCIILLIVVLTGFVVGCESDPVSPDVPEASPVEGQWVAVSASINGIPISPLVLADCIPLTVRLELTFESDGDFLGHQFDALGNVIVLDTARYTVEGQTIRVTGTDGNHEIWNWSMIGTDLVLSTTYETETRVMTLSPVASSQPLAADLIGAWQAISATLNGAPIPVLEATDSDPGTVRAIITFATNGIFVTYDLGAEDVVLNEYHGTYSTSGSTLVMQSPGEDPETWTWSIDSGQLVLEVHSAESHLIIRAQPTTLH